MPWSWRPAGRVFPFDADALYLKPFERPKDITGLLIDELREKFEVVEVVGEQRIDCFARTVQELHWRRRRRFGERIDFDLLHQSDGLIRLAFDLKSSYSEQDGIRGGLRDKISFGSISAEARR